MGISRTTAGIWICMAAALVLWQCGGQAVSTAPAPGAVDANGAGSANGGSANADECVGGAAADGGCNQGGDSQLEAYARLRTACSLNVRVNRRGGNVPICFHIR